jgi:hypothetical protein
MFYICSHYGAGAASMLSYESSAAATGLSERPPGPWIASWPERSAPAGKWFAVLSRTPLASRFVSWQGRSGKTYVFSVYGSSDCPAFCDAVMLAVAPDEDGRRRILRGFDTGAFPEPALARAEREFRSSAKAVEFHVHLLARSLSERQTVLADLEAAGAL